MTKYRIVERPGPPKSPPRYFIQSKGSILPWWSDFRLEWVFNGYAILEEAKEGLLLVISNDLPKKEKVVWIQPK